VLRVFIFLNNKKDLVHAQERLRGQLRGCDILTSRSDQEAFDFLALAEGPALGVIETGKGPALNLGVNVSQLIVTGDFPGEVPDRCDILRKPFSWGEFDLRIRRLLEATRFEEKNRELQIAMQTGWPGYAEMLNRLDREWKRSLRYERWISMICLTASWLDPARVDDCLHRAADELFVLDGNRFCALLPETDAGGAAAVAGRMESDLPRNKVPPAIGTASLQPLAVYRGMVHQPSGHAGSEMLLDQARQAQAGSARINRVMHFSDLVDN
jgi:hypothetical protein